MSIKTYILGLGNIGMLYDYSLDPCSYILTHAQALSFHDQFSIVGAYDPDVNKQQLFLNKYNKPTLFRYITGNIDLVVISSPTQYVIRLLIDF